MHVVCQLQGMIYTLNGQLHDTRLPSGAASEGDSVQAISETYASNLVHTRRLHGEDLPCGSPAAHLYSRKAGHHFLSKL